MYSAAVRWCSLEAVSGFPNKHHSTNREFSEGKKYISGSFFTFFLESFLTRWLSDRSGRLPAYPASITPIPAGWLLNLPESCGIRQDGYSTRRHRGDADRMGTQPAGIAGMPAGWLLNLPESWGIRQDGYSTRRHRGDAGRMATQPAGIATILRSSPPIQPKCRMIQHKCRIIRHLC